MKFSLTLGLMLFLLLVSSTMQAHVPAAGEQHPEDDDSEKSSRIVGGTDNVDFSQHDFLVSIQSMAHLCMGTFVHKYLILTAASCVASISPNLLRIHYGSPYHNKNGWYVNVNKTIIHPEFDPVTMANDIALLWLKTAPINHYSQLVGFATPWDYVTTSTYINVTGFGFMGEFTGSLSNRLRMVKLRGVDHATCKQNYAVLGLNITNGAFCLSSWGGGRGKSICQGDIGAIAFTESYLPNRERLAIGLASYSIGCGQQPSEHPNVFTRLEPYRKWFNDYLKLADNLINK